MSPEVGGESERGQGTSEAGAYSLATTGDAERAQLLVALVAQSAAKPEVGRPGGATWAKLLANP